MKERIDKTNRQFFFTFYKLQKKCMVQSQGVHISIFIKTEIREIIIKRNSMTTRKQKQKMHNEQG